MKSPVRLLFPLFALASLLSVPAAAGDFQGKVAMENRSGKHVSAMTYFIGKDGVRVEMAAEKGGQPFVSIMKPAEKQMIILMPEQKKYMVQAFDPVKVAAKAQQIVKTTDPVKTGRSEKICGHRCDEYRMAAGSDTIEMWVVEGFGFFAYSGGKGGGKPSAWESIAREKGWFSLRTVTLDKSGKEKHRMEATSVESMKVGADLLKPPADYTEFKMPSIPGLKGLFGGEE